MVGVVSFVATPTAMAASRRAAESAGADSVGSASYIPASGAVFAAPWGSDAASGSAAAPVRTVTRAVALAPSSGTVVLRGGTYHEQVTLTKTVTIQNSPGEVVWMDGSKVVDGWVKDGSRWRHDGWTTRFDHSPTYTRGAPDSTSKDWQFVNTDLAPMAAHPDQLWIAGVRQNQAAFLSKTRPGDFYLDEATSRLYVGSDPSGKEVSAATITQALNIRAPGVVIRGIGIRRFSPSVWHMAAVVVEKPNAVLENVVVSEMATTGISVLAANVTLRKVTVQWSGMLGIHNRYADNLVYDRVRTTYNNVERFNLAPVSGGVKIAQTRGVTVTNSSFSDNFGHGFWEDMSVYNTVVRSSNFNANVGDGLFLEISARAVVVDSLFMNNGLDGIKINNVSNARVWNNTFIGNARSIWLAQDNRRNTNRSDAAVDPRVAWPDPEMPWQLQDITLRNNVIGLPKTSTNCILCVEDYSYSKSAEAMRISLNGDVYNRSSATSPQWTAIWSRGAGNPAVYTSLNSFRSGTGQEARGREYVGSAIVDAAGALNSPVQNASGDIALPLPSDLASLIDRPVGSTRLGAWFDSGATAPVPVPPVTTSPITPPTSGGVLARDLFSGKTTSGWGTADIGGQWTIPVAEKQFSVGNGVGQLKLDRGDGFEARLDGAKASGSDISVATSVDRDPTAAGHFISVIGRSVAGVGEYRAKARIRANGEVSLWLLKRIGSTETVFASTTLPGTTRVTTGQALKLRFRVTGVNNTQLDAKAWAASSGEPNEWALSAKDGTAGLQAAGSLGLWAYSDGSDQGTGITVYFDALEVNKN